MAGDTPGRKPKLTKDTEARLLALLRAGVPREVACAGVGIASRTLRIWLERARAGEERFEEFADKVEAAQAEAQAAMLVKIRKFGDKDWKAMAWVLERVFSERYGYKSQTKAEITGKDGSPLQGELTPAMMRSFVEEQFGRVGPRDDAATPEPQVSQEVE